VTNTARKKKVHPSFVGVTSTNTHSLAKKENENHMVQDILGFHSGDCEDVVFWDVRLCVVW
jgi:hypothetical protein